MVGEGHNFSKTGVLRAAFEYQDLVAVQVLIEFLRDRDSYDWIMVEAEETDFRAIDDVVACRKDGKFELTQVKFTPDPTEHRLSWRWLTDHKPKGTSLVEKWAQTVLRHKHDGTLARAILKTDRRPDDEFEECLCESHVEYDRLDPTIKRVVDEQIGSSLEAAEFFECFEFIHSQEQLDNFEEKLRSQLAYDTDSRGWAHFRDSVRYWAMRKNAPRPDGKIRHHHLVQIFSPERPTALPQDFIVPRGYSVPDEAFHRMFVEENATTDGVVVLWGPPGRGKSTYLSHCVTQLSEREDVVCIRHHYFLRLGDRTEGRFSYFAIARSLIRQLEDLGLLTRSPEMELGEAVATAASELKYMGRRLVVVVDGLDHVWREGHDLAQMEELFNRLIPLPEGVRLVVGTQKVKDQYLPRCLITHLPKNRWTELPAMSVQAVQDWLVSQRDAGRLSVEEMREEMDKPAIEELALAFHRISAGLPLHLVYSLEALLKAGDHLTPESVARLPVCPTGEIGEYYESLWVGLKAGSQRVLHLLAGLKFSPPSFGLGSCLEGEVDWWAALDEVGHLLECREASVVPFHGSLFAFLRGREEHEDVFSTLVGDVEEWLKEKASDYWRCAWLWVTQAQQGDLVGLVDGPTRQWAIDWLKSGYPVDQLIYILNQAEAAALATLNFCRLIHLRSIKIRALNARDYQTNEWGSFLETSLLLSEDKELGAVFRDNIPEFRTEELLGVVNLGPPEVRRRVIRELNRQNTISYSSEDQGNWSVYANAIMRITAREEGCAEKVIDFAERSGADGLVETYVGESVRVGNYANVFAVGMQRTGYGLDRHTFAALCIEGIGANAKEGLVAANRPLFQSLTLLKEGRQEGDIVESDVSKLFLNQEDLGLGLSIREAGHEVFFSSLAVALSGGVAEGRAKFGESGESTWLGRALRELERVAGQVGGEWLRARRWPTLREVYQFYTMTQLQPMSPQDQSRMIGIRLALQDIAVDLCLMGTKILRQSAVGKEDIQTVTKSAFWSLDAWLEAFYERPLPLHSGDGAEEVLAHVRKGLEERIVPFNERAETAIKMARFALDYGLREVSGAELEKAADCLLGYGWRKDSFVYEVIESLELLAKRDDVEAKNLFVSLAKEIEGITDYTDGDGTWYAREQFYRGIIKLFPERAPKLYSNLIARQEWYWAEKVAVMYAENLAGDSVEDRQLLETFIGPREFDVAWEMARQMDENRPSIREILGRLAGRDGPLPTEAETDDPTEEALAAMPDPNKFEPGRLDDFIEKTQEEISLVKTEPVSYWLRHWDSRGKFTEALDDLENVIGKRYNYFAVAEGLDTAFEISLEREGRSKAYFWLVRANIENKGWVRWWSDELRFKKRVRAVATEYRDKWCEFAVETSQTEGIGEIESNGITVGMSRLVYFLIEVGEVELAKACTREMTDTFRNEVSQQPLTVPAWAK